MGTSSDSNENKNTFNLKKLPYDQYVCTECISIPESISLYYNEGIIEFNCKTHNTKKVDIREYFEKESKFLYYNCICDYDKRKQKDNFPYIF